MRIYLSCRTDAEKVSSVLNLTISSGDAGFLGVSGVVAGLWEVVLSMVGLGKAEARDDPPA
jgi:hypothetical protein